MFILRNVVWDIEISVKRKKSFNSVKTIPVWALRFDVYLLMLMNIPRYQAVSKNLQRAPDQGDRSCTDHLSLKKNQIHYVLKRSKILPESQTNESPCTKFMKFSKSCRWPTGGATPSWAQACNMRAASSPRVRNSFTYSFYEFEKTKAVYYRADD